MEVDRVGLNDKLGQGDGGEDVRGEDNYFESPLAGPLPPCKMGATWSPFCPFWPLKPFWPCLFDLLTIFAFASNISVGEFLCLYLASTSIARSHVPDICGSS